MSLLKNVGKDAKKSRSSLRTIKSSDTQRYLEDVYIPPLEILTVKIKHIRIKDEVPQWFSVQSSFFDQIILSGVMKSVGYKETADKSEILTGTMAFDPSDYEKMCLFADSPLKVNIQPLKNTDTTDPFLLNSTQSTSRKSSSKSSSTKDPSNKSPVQKPYAKSYEDMSSCNIDILPLFLELNRMKVKKRLEPVITPTILHRKSWCNLPLVTLEISLVRNEANKVHHKLLKSANHMQITLIAGYNMIIPYSNDYMYSASSKLPLYNENKTGIVIFNEGHKRSVLFNNLSFYPKWENLRLGDEPFTKGDEKFICRIDDIKNDDNIDMEYYFKKFPYIYSTTWGSFHRTLMLGNTETWLWKHLRKYHWPLEIHINHEKGGGYSFMAPLNLTNLLHPGETVVRMVVPLEWMNADMMRKKCGCDPLLTAYEIPSAIFQRNTSPSPSGSYVETRPPPTGADDDCAFVLLEVKLGRPLVEISIPPYIYRKELNEMLDEFENSGPIKRSCTGRGQQEVDWQSTIGNAVGALRRVPYHGMTEFCTFYRQLSETRTRVEISTSCWQDAAIYVNNNFIVQTFLESEETYEEMLMMAHACLMRIVCTTVAGVEDTQEQPLIRAARHARQMQDNKHATDLYLQRITQIPRCANIWRELATCLIDIDKEWANVCINKAVVLEPRSPLSLLVKGGMLFEHKPEEAEPFFDALLSLYPFWSTAWIIVYAYYTERQLYNLADLIMEYSKKSFTEGLSFDLGRPRSWGYELGDWWDNTPLLPGMSKFYDAVDLLLRLRAISLAEVCLSRALADSGESAAYYHLLALCCRLKGNIKDALCHLKTGIEKYGDISYLRSLEAECYHVEKNIQAAITSFEKAGSGLSAYSIMLSVPSWESTKARTLLVDLVRRQPSAYSWMALAENWMTLLFDTSRMQEDQPAEVTSSSTSNRSLLVIEAVASGSGQQKKIEQPPQNVTSPLTQTSAMIEECSVQNSPLQQSCLLKTNSSLQNRAAIGEGGDAGPTDEQVAARNCAVACAVQALKWDRRAGRPWALLSKLVKPSARRLYCRNMAVECGYELLIEEDKEESKSASLQSLCYRLSKSLRGCRCALCDHLNI